MTQNAAQSAERRDLETGTEELLGHVADGVAVLTLNRPAQRNALSFAIFEALGACLNQIGRDPEVGCVILTGAGQAFCAGGDVRDLQQQSASAESDGPGLERRVATVRHLQRETALALHALPIPTLAVLPGPAAGAGLSLAMACDLRFGSERAMLVTAFTQLAVSGDFGLSWFLTRIVGPARARELCFLSERIEAQRALELGLLTRLVPEAELAAHALEVARGLAHGPRIALGYLKENLNRALVADLVQSLDAEALAMVRTLMSEDHREAARAFLEKRAPQFRGR